jgi:mono/diheme cytochrome c family protein
MSLRLLAALAAAVVSLPSRAAPDVARIWDQACSACHGDDGSGPEVRVPSMKPPDFTDPRWQAKKSDKQLRQAITSGVAGTKMKPFKEKYDAEQIDALVQRVRGFQRR